MERGDKYMIETVSENDHKVFKEKVDRLILQGYKISSTNCGYAGEVGGNVYDCEYWMAILIKEWLNMKDINIIIKDAFGREIKN